MTAKKVEFTIQVEFEDDTEYLAFIDELNFQGAEIKEEHDIDGPPDNFVRKRKPVKE